MKTSEKIKTLRLSKGLTQEELGNMVGIKKAAINKYETGRVVNIKRSTLKSLADALEVAPVDLLDDEETILVNEDGDVFAASQLNRAEQRKRLFYYISMMDSATLEMLIGVAKVMCGEENKDG